MGAPPAVPPGGHGIIVVGLPRVSRDTMLRVMSPETVAWMLRQMDPIEAGRVGTRLGARVLPPVLGQLHPQQAFRTLRRLPTRTARELAAMLPRRSEAETALLEHPPDTVGSLVVGRFPSVAIGGGDRRWRSTVAPSLRVPACARSTRTVACSPSCLSWTAPTSPARSRWSTSHWPSPIHRYGR